ncbi:MAG: DUF2062 domain-containing protein [Fulvivirga sp.]
MTHSRFEKYNCCVLIPTYNNAGTLQQVVDSVLEVTTNVIVVDDGSTDQTPDLLQQYKESVEIITHDKNKGKGRALRNGFKHALAAGYDYAITIDSDGQHFASDLPKFIDEIESNPSTLVIGARNMSSENVPGKSSFGNKFSNFWFWFETGIKLDDTQSGYRLYPIKALSGIKFFTNKFEFEVEVIVKAAWSGLNVKNIPIQIHYEPGDKRISHFRPFQDFSRISLLNTWLVTLALLYYIPLRFFKKLTRENIRAFIQQHFFNEDESTSRKAFSIGFGFFMGIFPVWGYQMLLGVAIAHLLKLNKALFLVAANISLPPLIPFIIYGSYKIGALLVSDPRNDLFFTSEITFELVKDNLFQYIVGAITLALAAGIFGTIMTFITVTLTRKRS